MQGPLYDGSHALPTLTLKPIVEAIPGMRRNGNKASLPVRNLEIYGVERNKYGFDRKNLCNVLKIQSLKLARSSD
jgi:hypothetical protein